MRSSLRVLEHLASPIVALIVIAVVTISLASRSNEQAGSVSPGSNVRQWAVGSDEPAALKVHLPEDEDLLNLERPESIRALQLEGANVSDVGMKILMHTPRLWILDLSNTRVTGKSLMEIRHLCGLEFLLLTDLEVHDHELPNLKQLPLLGLSLAGTSVTDTGLGHLTALRQLSWLDLAGTKVSDSGIRHLTRLRELTVLDVGATDVSNDIVHILLELPSLQHVNLRETRVTRDAVDALCATRPKLSVEYE